MKHYYYAENNQQFGPFTLKELKEKRLKKSILVWAEGMPDWVIADTIEELNGFLISEPPPLPSKITIEKNTTIQIKKKPVQKTSAKYDLTYKKETDLIGWGIFLLILNGIAYLIQINSEGFYIAFSVFSLIVRILVAFWIVKVARRQNRNTNSWAWFTFFFPVISLIIIGSLKKLKLKIFIDEGLPIEKQVTIIVNKVNDLFNNSRYSESIQLLNKALEIDNNNPELLRLRGISYYKLFSIEHAEKDFLKINKIEIFSSEINYILGNIEIKRYNREKAVEYWLIASKYGHQEAKRKLQTYYKYYGIFVLNKNDIFYKLRDLSKFESRNHLLKLKYLGGIKEVDDNEDISKLKSFLVNFYSDGFFLKIKSKTETYNIGILYFEIEDIICLIKNNKYRYKLINDTYIDINENLDGMLPNYKKETGITPSILK